MHFFILCIYTFVVIVSCDRWFTSAHRVAVVVVVKWQQTLQSVSNDNSTSSYLKMHRSVIHVLHFVAATIQFLSGYTDNLARQLRALQLRVNNCARCDNCSHRQLRAPAIARKEIDRESIARESMNSRNDHKRFIRFSSTVYAIYVCTESWTVFDCAVAGYGRTDWSSALSLCYITRVLCLIKTYFLDRYSRTWVLPSIFYIVFYVKCVG